LPVEVSPDILTMAKPLANGFPIGAVLSSQAVAEEIKVGDHGESSIHYCQEINRCISGTTFGGNPLATRIAHHVFERLSSPETLTQVCTTSQLFVSHLHQLQLKFPNMINTIRGRGLILGLQLKPLHNKDATTIANSIVAHARQRGLLIITAGEGTIRFVPPLNIPEDVVLEGLGILEGAMEEVSRKGV
jgi:acetylornithine aminotransferase